MKIKISVLIAFALSLCILLSSCQSDNFIRTVDSLLTPPLYYAEYEDLVDTFTSNVNGNVVLCNPAEGDHLSAISVTDIDGDGNEEGIVLYRDPLDDNLAHFSVYKKAASGWQLCGDYTGYGNEVESLVLADIDGDSIEEIIIIWNYSGISNADTFSVYRASDKNLEYLEIGMQSCDIAKPIDIDLDGTEEIFFVSSENDNEIPKKTARLMKYIDSSLQIIGETPVDPNVGGYVSFKTGIDANTGSRVIYMDASKSGNMLITEVVAWNAKTRTLEAPLFDPVNNSNTVTLRYEPIQCDDINGDGKIEIPVQILYREAESEEEKNVYLTRWTYFNNSYASEYLETYVNYKEGYFIELDTVGKSDITFREVSGEDWNGLILYGKASYTNIGDVVMSVVNIPIEKWESGNYEEYIPIIYRLNSVICVNIGSAGKSMGLNEGNVKNIVKTMP